jgi:hypothetical protein
MKANLFNLLGHNELNGVRYKLRMLLDDLLDLLLLDVFHLVLLEVQTNLGTTSERRVNSVGGDGERTTGGRLPDVLFVVVVLRDYLDALGDEVSRVKANTELANHGDVGAGAESLHEALK